MCCCLLVFFFKQKTAYDMRISDWSSDVCSSDLGGYEGVETSVRVIRVAPFVTDKRPGAGADKLPADQQGQEVVGHHQQLHTAGEDEEQRHQPGQSGPALLCCREIGKHTSELPALIRISHPVFCVHTENHHAADTGL